MKTRDRKQYVNGQKDEKDDDGSYVSDDKSGSVVDDDAGSIISDVKSEVDDAKSDKADSVVDDVKSDISDVKSEVVDDAKSDASGSLFDDDDKSESVVDDEKQKSVVDKTKSEKSDDPISVVDDKSDASFSVVDDVKSDDAASVVEKTKSDDSKSESVVERAQSGNTEQQQQPQKEPEETSKSISIPQAPSPKLKSAPIWEHHKEEKSGTIFDDDVSVTSVSDVSDVKQASNVPNSKQESIVDLVKKMRAESTHFLILKIDEGSSRMVCEKKVEHESSNINEKDEFNNFVKALPKDDCRFAVLDFREEGKEEKKLCFIFWNPKNADSKSQTIYKNTKRVVYEALNEYLEKSGVQIGFSVTGGDGGSDEELTLEVMKRAAT